MLKHKTLGQYLTLALISASLLSACGRHVPMVTDVQAGQPSGNAPASPITGSPTNNFGSDPGYGSTLPQPQAPQDPIDTPSPLPAPQNPVKPGEPMIAKAVSNTTAFAVPQISKWFQVNGVYVHNDLSWQPVQGAAEYWVFKGQLPTFQEARRELAYAIVPAGFAGSGFKDGLQPPNLKSGDIFERIKRSFNSITNQPGVTYNYKVIAVDRNGVQMSESGVVAATALPAVSTAVMDQAQDVNTLNPLFTWKAAQQGVQPDGYYVSVFPSVQLSGGSLPPTSMALWTVFRPRGTHVVRYGQDSANKVSYSGTLPFDITFNLGAGKNYSWSVVSVKTDTGNMKTAKAISRSWSGFGHFQLAANATGGNVSSMGFNQYSQPQQPVYQQNAYPQQQPGYYAPQQQPVYQQNAYQQPGYYAPQQQAYQQPGYYAPQQQAYQQPGYYAPQQQRGY